MRAAINVEHLESFRKRVRCFCADKLPADLRQKAQRRILEKADYVRWQKILYQHGWMGGTGRTKKATAKSLRSRLWGAGEESIPGWVDGRALADAIRRPGVVTAAALYF